MRKRQEVKATVYNKKGHVLGVGYNSYTKTHPYQAELACKYGHPLQEFLHAEVAALIKSLKKGKPHKIRIERYGSKGEPVLAAPCPICTEAIKLAGIHFVEYTI